MSFSLCVCLFFFEYYIYILLLIWIVWFVIYLVLLEVRKVIVLVIFVFFLKCFKGICFNIWFFKLLFKVFVMFEMMKLGVIVFIVIFCDVSFCVVVFVNLMIFVFVVI